MFEKEDEDKIKKETTNDTMARWNKEGQECSKDAAK
jgi:hypothetical protein